MCNIGRDISRRVWKWWFNNHTVIDTLKRIVGAQYVLSSSDDVAVYKHDATPLFSGTPDAVVLPRTTAEIQEIVKYAAAAGIPVVARGSGSSLSAGTVPIHGGIVLSLTRMDQIKEINPAEMLAVVEPGVTTAELVTAALKLGLLYPPDPGSKIISTMGGNVATSAGGLRGLKYGVTRNYVLGLEVVLGTGEVIRTGGRLWKDVAGYDLTRLLTGSEGTLGIITEITVALVPNPAQSLNGIAYFASLKEASHAVNQIIAAGLLPATLEFLDQKCIIAVDEYANLNLDRTAGALLLFGDDGDLDVVNKHMELMERACLETGGFGIEIATEITRSEQLLEARRCSLPALSRLAPTLLLEDVGVPRPYLAEMVAKINLVAEKYQVICATFGHAGDGNLHPTIAFDEADPDAKKQALAAFDEIFSLAISFGGSISGEHGVGAAKLPWLKDQIGAEQVALLKRIKFAFDPHGILNPGKLGS